MSNLKNINENAEPNKDLFVEKEILTFFKNGSNVIMSRLMNGKYVFLNKGEKKENMTLGMPYICAIKELDTVAFAKIISSVFIPRILLIRDEETKTDKIMLVDEKEDGIERIFIKKEDIVDVMSKYKKVLVINQTIAED